MPKTTQKIVIPSLDLGGTKIDFAFLEIGKERKIAKQYPTTPVIKAKGQIDADRTLKLIATWIKQRAREMEQKGWIVLKLVGMGAPGLYLEDRSVDPKSVPNIPRLANTKPAVLLEKWLGKNWRVYINNDGVIQAMAAAHALVHSPGYKQKWERILRQSKRKVIYFGPGTGFGAGKVLVYKDKQIEPMPGNQALFDTVIRQGKTAEDLLGGNGIGRTAQALERINIEKGKPVLLKYTEGYENWCGDREGSTESQLKKITGKVVAEAYSGGDRAVRKMAREIFIQAGQDLAALIIKLHQGRGKKKIFKWEQKDWQAVKGIRIFLAAGLLIKPTGKKLILPSARKVLKEAGLADTIVIIELDELPAISKMNRKIGILGASLIIPEKEILERKWNRSLIMGSKKVNRYICDVTNNMFYKRQRPILLALDGYSGVEWPKTVQRIEKSFVRAGFQITSIDFSLCYKSPEQILKLTADDQADDKTFGRRYPGKLNNFLSKKRLKDLQQRLDRYRKQKTGSPKAVLCFGPGSASPSLRKYWDLVIYRDLTREEIAKRHKKGLVVPLGSSGKDDSHDGQPAYLAGKRFHYVDFPVLDRHKRAIQNKIDFYIDDNLPDQPKLIDQTSLDEMIAQTSKGPIQLKTFHDEGVWGGQWLKKIRHLPEEMVNCAWAYELMAYQMSLKIPIDQTYLELPFANILDKEPDRIMGEQVKGMFNGMWPIRVNYDDCWHGGDMAIQIHPEASYIKNHFNEPLHQDESYYIVDATPEAYVYLGLKEGIDLDAFHYNVQRAEKEGIPFDHRKYVNVFPAKQGDLFLIPAGTVHASGKGSVVMELSSTTDRYTFHFYDYLRPDLNGSLRDIHSRHAFNMVRRHSYRTTAWVKKHLIQKARCIRRGKGWAEYVIGRLDRLVFEVRRFEFEKTIEDDTKGLPHVLSMVEGDGIIIQAREIPGRDFHLRFSETVLVPAALGKYVLLNQSPKPCRVLKTLVNTSFKPND